MITAEHLVRRKLSGKPILDTPVVVHLRKTPHRLGKLKDVIAVDGILDKLVILEDGDEKTVLRDPKDVSFAAETRDHVHPRV